MLAEHILLAEDDADFALLIQLSFQAAGISHSIAIVSDGQEAIRYLNGDGGYADRGAYPLPSLAVLDVKLGQVSGFHVLEWIRAQPTLKDVRVVLLSSFGTEADAKRAEELGADSYMVKPFKFQELIETVKALSDSWLRVGDSVKTCADMSKAAHALPSIHVSDGHAARL